MHRYSLVLSILLLLPLPAALAAPAPANEPNVGYYRQPSLRGDVLVFASEGDLWRGSVSGGRATRLTSHPGAESAPFLSPDGSMIAFSANYEGVQAAYVMPTAGGLPTRLTWDGARVNVVGWSRDAKVLVATDAESTLPCTQLIRVDPVTGAREVLPLAQAADGTYTDSGVLVFTRLAFQGSQTARYKGGTAQKLWRWDPAHPDIEATPLAADFDGTSKNPMAYNGRIYFLTDRDGTMNLWSMAEDGSAPKQLTHSKGWDIQSATLDSTSSGGTAGARIAYRVGADIHVLDIASTGAEGADTLVPFTLDSDLDQTREHWISSPMDWASSIDLAPNGEALSITARGGVWVIPKTPGRVVSLTNAPGVRWRSAEFAPDGKSVIGLSDASGEVELTEVPADGSADPTGLSKDGAVLRVEVEPSPDGSLIAHTDKNQRLWLYSRATGISSFVTSSAIDIPSTPTFSADGKMLAWVEPGANTLRQIHLQDIATGVQTTVTTDRYDSWNPVFSPDGRWLYFLSDRNFVSSVDSPWGTYAPQPHFEHRAAIYALALQPDAISPFQPYDELRPKPAEETDAEPSKADKKVKASKTGKKDSKKDGKKDRKNGKDPDSDLPAILVDGLASRIWPVPVAPGNHAALSVSDGALYWTTSEGSGETAGTTLNSLAIGNEPPEVKVVAAAIDSYQLSRDGSRLLIVKGGAPNIVDAAPAEADLSKAAVDLSGWSFAVDPREEWRQMFVEAWRLERDYFYATNMHGVDWSAVLARYQPLVARVRSRAELSDLIGQMVSQLSALHTFVYGGDMRTGPDWIGQATLGAALSPVAGGVRIDRIYQSDPDLLERRSPLQVPGVDVQAGDVIHTVDHREVTTENALASALRSRAGHPVLLGYTRGSTEMKALVRPLDGAADQDLRYLDWEIERRNRVEREGGGKIGYVHLRAMGAADINEWTRSYFPVFNREGLIIDVRHNRGGNIDSWILGQLLRRPWFYWSQRIGAAPSWNMQYAFRGPVVVLCDENTASDGEAFTEGIRRLGIGKVIGTRTWGGEIWLSSSNFLVDGGIATAAEYGVYGPEGAWLIEGHGVEPDEVVDNLPHATFNGSDKQLEAAMRYLQEELLRNPVQDVPRPALPDKSDPSQK